MVTAEQALHMATQNVKVVKRLRCTQEEGPVDLAQMLHVFYTDGTHQVALLLADREAIPSVLADIRNDRREQYVALISDAFARQLPPGTELDRALNARGSVNEAFHAGDMTVQEMLVVILLDVERDGVHESRTPYYFTDKGKLRFRDTEVSHDGVDGYTVMGRIPELLRAGVTT